MSVNADRLNGVAVATKPTLVAGNAAGLRVREHVLPMLAVNAFAFAQPILGKLLENLQYLRQENMSGVAVLTTMAILFLGMPCGLISLMLACKRIAKPGLGYGLFLLSLVIYGTLIGLLLGRWVSAERSLLQEGVSDFVILGAALPLGIMFGVLYHRFAGVRQCLSLSAVSVLLFPVSFFSSPTAREIVLGLESRDYSLQSTADSPAPLVMIVFDGMTGMSLLNESHEIDAVRYPNFGRLAKRSTFFRNATTVHTRTDHALPAMLSSAVPEERWLPVEADYPTNLFRLLHNSHQFDMTIFEPFTQMAPSELRYFDQKRTASEEVAELCSTTIRLYVNLVFPREITSVSIPRSWFGLAPKAMDPETHAKGRIVYAWDQFRRDQTDHFVSSIKVTSKPGLYFLHVAVPHYPWTLLPDGRSYLADVPYAMTSIHGANDETWCDDEWLVQQCWQRNLLQIQFADHVIGQILDRLSETDLLDSTMMVVTADHGLAFHAGRSMRELSEQTMPDLLSVPLFVKVPGQSTGKMTDRSVETLDVLPTIADVLKIPADPKWEGVSVFSDEVRMRKTIAGKNPTMIDAEFASRFQYVDRMTQVFGSGGVNDRLGRLSLIPSLTGALVEKLKGQASSRAATASWGLGSMEQADTHFVRCFLTGTLLADAPLSEPVRIAVAVDGVVAVTTRTSLTFQGGKTWTAIIPTSLLGESDHKITIYEIRGSQDPYSLHQIGEAL